MKNPGMLIISRVTNSPGPRSGSRPHGYRWTQGKPGGRQEHRPVPRGGRHDDHTSVFHCGPPGSGRKIHPCCTDGKAFFHPTELDAHGPTQRLDRSLCSGARRPRRVVWSALIHGDGTWFADRPGDETGGLRRRGLIMLPGIPPAAIGARRC